MESKKLGPFIGLNNRLPDFAMRKSTRDFATNGYYLREADDVDIDNSRGIRRREVDKNIFPIVGAHSLFQLQNSEDMYEVRVSKVWQLTRQGGWL